MATEPQPKTGSSLLVSNAVKVMVVALALGIGFAAGYMVTKDRYTSKISVISEMNMKKAVAIDSLQHELRVLGASTEAKK